jgi:hypothetical protein
MADFKTFLKSVLIYFPGTSDTVTLEAKNEMLNFFCSNYSGWQTSGKVISIPEVRRPKVFLQKRHLPPFLQQRFGALLKGEEAECRVYDQILSMTSCLQSMGMLLFVGINTNELFRNCGLLCMKQELDHVALHPKKGIIIIEIKGGRKKLTKQDYERSNQRTEMIEAIRDFGDFSMSSIPIQYVLITLERNLTPHELFTGKVIRATDGDDSLRTKLQELFLPSPEEPQLEPILLDYIGSKLAVLASMQLKRRVTLFQDIATNTIAAIKPCTAKKIITTEDFIQHQLSDNLLKIPTKAIIAISPLMKQAETCTTVENGNSKQVIVWTKEQLEVIMVVLKALIEREKDGLRLLVMGGKGTGETWLLIYLTKLIKSFMDANPENEESKLLVTCLSQYPRTLLANKLDDLVKTLNSDSVIFYRFDLNKYLEGIKQFSFILMMSQNK